MKRVMVMLLVTLLAIAAVPPAALAQPARENEERSRKRMWTGIGLTIGGGVFLLQSVALYDCGRHTSSRCDEAARAVRVTGGVLAATGVTLILLDDIEKRRGARVALGLSPRTVRLDVSF